MTTPLCPSELFNEEGPSRRDTVGKSEHEFERLLPPAFFCGLTSRSSVGSCGSGEEARVIGCFPPSNVVFKKNSLKGLCDLVSLDPFLEALGVFIAVVAVVLATAVQEVVEEEATGFLLAILFFSFSLLSLLSLLPPLLRLRLPPACSSNYLLRLQTLNSKLRRCSSTDFHQ